MFPFHLFRRSLALLPMLFGAAATVSLLGAEPASQKWIDATAYAIPKETTNAGSGYFSIVTGKNGRVYVGAAKYGVGASLVEFEPKSKEMKVVVDTQKEIGTTATGFAAQSKIHTRNNVGASGKIYFGTKQGYPDKTKGENQLTYAGGHPMVYDPETGTTKVYPIAFPHHGIISITPDESRDIAYISTCADNGSFQDPKTPNVRRAEDSHFMILDLKTGKYRDLMDCHHLFAFICIDHEGRAYHPIQGGDIARYDPNTDKLERLKQTIDGKPPAADSYFAIPETHCINWEISLDGKTLYALPLSDNQLYSYDLTATGDTLPGKSLGALIPGAKTTDCRAMCVGPTGDVWAAVCEADPQGWLLLHLVSYHPGDKSPRDHGQVAVGNPDFTDFKDKEGKPLVHHTNFVKNPEGKTINKYAILGISQGQDGAVYVLALSPYTLLQIPLSALK